MMERPQGQAVLLRRCLQAAGRHGAAVVILGLVVGFLVPGLAEAARPLLALAVLIFSFGSFLKLDGGAAAEEWRRAPLTLLVAAWCALGIPLATALLLRLLPLDPGLAQGVLLWAAVPTSAASVAFAAILGLAPSLALVATVVGTAAAPLLLPLLMATAGGGIALATDPLQLCLNLLGLLGGAAALALVARRLAGGLIAANPDAMTGITVLALMLAGLGSMRGVQAAFLAEPLRVLALLLLAYLLLIGTQILGTLLFWPLLGARGALTAGLAGGTRTITLAWVVLGPEVSHLANLFLAMAMVAKYTSPALSRPWLARLLPPRR
jgi:BASS family bile acid:Na+ symporter